MMNFKDKQDVLRGIKDYLQGSKQVIGSLDVLQIQIAIEFILDAYFNDRFIFVFGNGGSASTASHWVVDFNKGISSHFEKKFKVICLNDNIPIILAISNDMKYNQIFRFQLENYLQKDDLVIGISGSGNSPNVIEGIEYANSMGAKTLGLVGYDGGKLMKIAHHSIHVPVFDMQQVEDTHLAIQHLIVRNLINYLAEVEKQSTVNTHINRKIGERLEMPKVLLPICGSQEMQKEEL